MLNKVDTRKFSFAEPAIYEIVVNGVLDNFWSERLGGLQVSYGDKSSKDPTTTLVGRFEDQAALAGVLNMLYNHHRVLISVTMQTGL